MNSDLLKFQAIFYGSRDINFYSLNIFKVCDKSKMTSTKNFMFLLQNVLSIKSVHDRDILFFAKDHKLIIVIFYS